MRDQHIPATELRYSKKLLTDNVEADCCRKYGRHHVERVLGSKKFHYEANNYARSVVDK